MTELLDSRLVLSGGGDSESGKSALRMRISQAGNANGRFYEGVCQTPLNPGVQRFSGSSPRDTVAVTLLSTIELQVFACR